MCTCQRDESFPLNKSDVSVKTADYANCMKGKFRYAKPPAVPEKVIKLLQLYLTSVFELTGSKYIAFRLVVLVNKFLRAEETGQLTCGVELRIQLIIGRLIVKGERIAASRQSSALGFNHET